MAVLIDCWPVWSELHGGDYVPYKEIDRVCSYFLKGAAFSEAFQKRRWDGVIHKYKNGRFPTGLLWKILEVLDAHNIPYEVRQHFEYPEKKYDWLIKDEIQMRDRHMQAITCIDYFKRGTLQLPTRFGEILPS